MNGRDHIVGREMIVGSHGHHPDDDMDELLHHTSTGAEPVALARRPQQHHEEHPQRVSRQYDYRQQRAQHAPPPEEYYDPPPQRRAQYQPQHHAPQHQGPRIVHQEPTHEKRRHFPIGFTSIQIPAGTVAEVEVKPQVLFRGERLAVAPSNARSFNIVDIKVGKDSQLAATGEMPAEAFSALSVGVRMELDTAQPGIVIVLIVRNKDTVPQDFDAVLYGTVFED